MENKRFGETIYGEVILNGGTNDKIMSRWGRSFINNKNIFSSNLNTVSFHFKIKL